MDKSVHGKPSTVYTTPQTKTALTISTITYLVIGEGFFHIIDKAVHGYNFIVSLARPR